MDRSSLSNKKESFVLNKIYDQGKCINLLFPN